MQNVQIITGRHRGCLRVTHTKDTVLFRKRLVILSTLDFTEMLIVKVHGSHLKLAIKITEI